MRFNVLFALLVAGLASAESWQNFGPRGFSVAALARVPGIVTRVYAVAEGHPALVWYSSDGGTSWSLRDTIHDRVSDLKVNPDQTLVLYAGGRSGRIWRSQDGGLSWVERGALTGIQSLQRLVLRPGEPLFVRAAVEMPGPGGSNALGCYVSTDGGATWTGTEIDTGQVVHATALTYDLQQPDRLLLSGSISGQARLFVSTNGGAGWADITGNLTGGTVQGAAVNPVDSEVILAATDNGIWRSTNSGNTWTRMNDARAWSVAFGASAPHYAYAGADNLVYRSNNLGINWFADTTDFAGTATRWLEINPLDGLDLYVGNGRGVWRTTDGGYRWSERTANMGRLTMSALRFHPFSADSVFTCPYGYGLLVSGDRGISWELLPGFAGAGFITDVALNPIARDTLYAITSEDYRIHMTSDQGDSWTHQLVEPGFSGQGLVFHPFGPDTMYAWGGLRDLEGQERFGFWKSTDRGYNWARVFSPGTYGRCIGFRFRADGDSMFLWGEVDGRARVYLSRNHGATWLDRSSGLGGRRVRDFITAPGDHRTSYLTATDAGVFRTLNAGEGWTRLGLENVSGVLADTLAPDFLVAVTDTQGMFHTTNAGVFWERDTVELPYRSLTFLHPHPDDRAAIYCGTVGSGLYGRSVIGIGEPVPGPRLPRVEVTPTIVRTGAVVQFGPVAGQQTVLELFRPDGRRVGPVMVLDPTPATWFWKRPAGLPAGVYLLRIRSAGRDRQARVVLTD